MKHDFYLEKSNTISEDNNIERIQNGINKYENTFKENNKVIKMNDYIILKCYEEYKYESKQYSNKPHYGELWGKKNIYKY